MSGPVLDPRIFAELKAALDRGVASGELMTPAQVKQQTELFRDRFGPDLLRQRDGEELLQLMHGKQNAESKCLAYWLEFKNDDEFAGNRFGGIGGGTAFKFGIYQRQRDGMWMAGSVSGTGEELAACEDRLTMEQAKIIVAPPVGLPVREGSACD